MNPFDACLKKKQYPNRAKAKLAASRLRKIFLVRQRPYRCPRCRAYHLARKIPKMPWNPDPPRGRSP